MKTVSSIEPLEARIAPASLNAAGTILTYTDIDGDAVKVSFSHATMVASDFIFSVGFGSNAPQILDEINLTGKTGAGFTLTATPRAGQGDSHANIVSIGGASTDLGTISVDGDVIEIEAGTGAPGTVGLKSFTAFSFGQANDGSGELTLKNAGSFTVKRDFSTTHLTFEGGAKSISIGGDLRERFGGGDLHINGDIGSLKIGGSVIGDNRDTQQSITITGTAGTVSIGGSVIGGDQDLSGGQIDLGNVKTFSIGGDLRGGRGSSGGTVHIKSVGTFRIGGSVIATDDVSGSGAVFIEQTAGSITIGGSIVGGDATSDADGGGLAVNGVLIVGAVGSIKIGRDVIGGQASGGGSLDENSSAILVGGTVGTVTVGGSILGDVSHPFYIGAGGGGTAGPVNALKSLSVKGSIVYGRVLAGYTLALETTALNLDSSIGSVTIGGSLVASFIVAGSGTGSDGIPGNSDDNAVSTVATIGSVKIGGAFQGDVDSDTRYYIYAPIVNKLTVGKASYSHADLLPGGVSFDSIGKATALSVG